MLCPDKDEVWQARARTSILTRVRRAGRAPPYQSRFSVPGLRRPGYLGAQDTFYVGTMKGVGRIYQQTYIDT